MIEVIAYKCSVCSGLHETQPQAIKCAESCTKKKDKKEKLSLKLKEEEKKRKEHAALMEYPRLNATSLPHFYELVKEVALKAWNIDLNIRLSVQYKEAVDRLSYPYKGKGGQLPGLVGAIRGSYKSQDGRSPISCNDLFRGGVGISGIYIGSGGGHPGHFLYNVSLILEDFPIIRDNIIQYKQMKEEANVKIEKIRNQQRIDIAADVTIKRMRTEVENLAIVAESALASCVASRDRLHRYTKQRYTDLADSLVESINLKVSKFGPEHLGL